MHRFLPIVLILIGSLSHLAGCASEPMFSYRQIVMGAEATLTIAAPDEQTAREAGRAAFARLAELEAVMSDYRPDSEVMRLCARPREDVAISDDLFRALSIAQAVRETTDGDFDVTVGPMSVLWRQARASGTLPLPGQLADARRRTGGDLLALDGDHRTARLSLPGMRIDLGGIGKGLAAAEAVTTLRAHGCPRSLVAIAGDIAAGDAPPGRRAWRVRVDDPDGGGCVVELVHASISTSGDREQWIDVDGARHSHVVDPRTGVGATTRTQATVIGPDGAVVDALASVLSIRTPETGMALMNRFPGYAARLLAPREGQRTTVVETANWPPSAR